MKKIILAAAFTVLIAGVASAETVSVPNEAIAYSFTADDGTQGFVTKDGNGYQLVEAGWELTLGVPWWLNVGTIGSNGVHLGPEVAGTGGGVGIGLDGVGGRAEVLGHGLNGGVGNRGPYVAPGFNFGCQQYNNALANGVRNCWNNNR